MDDKKEVPESVREYFAAIGKKNGDKLFKERGSEYFSRIAAMRKNPFGKPRKVVEEV